jgi:hypothetical protein
MVSRGIASLTWRHCSASGCQDGASRCDLLSACREEAEGSGRGGQKMVLGDDVLKSAEVWREVEIENISAEGFFQDTSYVLGIPMSILLLLGPCHLLIGARRYPHAKLLGRETPTAKTEARVVRCR